MKTGVLINTPNTYLNVKADGAATISVSQIAIAGVKGKTSEYLFCPSRKNNANNAIHVHKAPLR